MIALENNKNLKLDLVRAVLPDFNEVVRCRLAGGKGPPC